MIIFLVLIILPLAFDIGRNKKSGIKISNKEITWFSGKFKGQLYLSDISSVEFKKRLDLFYRTIPVDQNNNKFFTTNRSITKNKYFYRIPEALRY